MHKAVLLILLTCTTLLAEKIHFEEKRYLYSLNKTINKQGVISSSKDELTILYQNGQKLIYRNDLLTISSRGKQKVIDLNKDLVMKLFFVVLQDIFSDDIMQLKQFFTIQSKGTQRILHPKALASKRIVKIIYQKSEKLDYLHIHLKNKDRISIEQVD